MLLSAVTEVASTKDIWTQDFSFHKFAFKESRKVTLPYEEEPHYS